MRESLDEAAKLMNGKKMPTEGRNYVFTCHCGQQAVVNTNTQEHTCVNCEVIWVKGT